MAITSQTLVEEEGGGCRNSCSGKHIVWAEVVVEWGYVASFIVGTAILRADSWSFEGFAKCSLGIDYFMILTTSPHLLCSSSSVTTHH